jgi:hypothetical protein
MLLPQVFFTLLAFIVVRVVMTSGRYWQVDNSPLLKILPVMGNMLGLPQLILTFTMLNIFLYNAYEIRLIPVWVFAIIVMVLGVAVLGLFFIQIIRQARRNRSKIPRE